MKRIRNLLFCLFLVPSLLAYLQPYMGFFSSYLSPFTLVVIPFSLIHLVLFIVTILGRTHWKWIFCFVLFIDLFLIKGSFVFGKHTEDKQTENTIRIVSWNVDNFLLSKDTLKESVSFILNHAPDIICLQERPHDNLLPWDSICSAFNYPYQIKNTREDEILNLAVFSKWKLSGLKEYYFRNTYNKFLQVDVYHPKGTFRLFNVHLQTTGISDSREGNVLLFYQKNSEQRNKQVRELVKAYKESTFPVIVCGDFNDVPISYVYHQMKSNLEDCFLEAGEGWGGTFQSLGNLFRIDYLFYSYEFQPLTYRLFSNPWSDHRIQYGKLNFQINN